MNTIWKQGWCNDFPTWYYLVEVPPKSRDEQNEILIKIIKNKIEGNFIWVPKPDYTIYLYVTLDTTMKPQTILDLGLSPKLSKKVDFTTPPFQEMV